MAIPPLWYGDDVCKRISNRMMLHFLYYWKYGVLTFGDDGTGPADESKKDKTCPGMVSSNYGREAFIICNTITL